MTVFVIDDAVRAQLASIKEFAEANRYDIAFMRKRVDLMNAGQPLPFYPDEHTATLPLDWWVTYTIEEHPGGWMRHMSMSSPKNGTLPIGPTLQFVMDELGYNLPLADCYTWPEEVPLGNRMAINVMEPMPPENPMEIN